VLDLGMTVPLFIGLLFLIPTFFSYRGMMNGVCLAPLGFIYSLGMALIFIGLPILHKLKIIPFYAAP
jgi:hypothetical protein